MWNVFLTPKIDDNNWNQENLKLGLIENQSYNDLNLDIKQFLNTNPDENNLNNSFLKDSNQLTSKLNKVSNKHSIFSLSEKLSNGHILAIEKCILNNYWETS